jgi:hypothetical protein
MVLGATCIVVIAIKEMQIFCKEKMMEQGTSKFIAWMFTRGIPRLERWKK